MPRWINAPQGSDLWLKARVGCLTASRMKDVLGTAAKREAYLWELVEERLTGMACDHYTTDAMKDGAFYEPHAKAEYENRTGQIIEDCGFALHDEIEWFGASPDGLISVNGSLETKCLKTKNHLKILYGGVIPADYNPQMLAQLAVTKRQWTDFVSYSPFLPDEFNFFHLQFIPTADQIAAIEDAARKFLAEVKEREEKVRSLRCG